MNTAETHTLLQTLQDRFQKNMRRHAGIAWPTVQGALDGKRAALQSLAQMESTGGEPDVVGQDPASGRVVFCDCSAESPIGRRSTCYDQEALDARKENKPPSAAVAMAAAMGIELLDEAQYLALQQLGEFDTRTSSWIRTPPDFRELGGALFGDRRYGRVFCYHNGAQSYYAARGFRGVLMV